jgi:hypothetical protein
MPLTLTLNDAAHAYGQDNYADSVNQQAVARWGANLGTENSWGSGTLGIGAAGSAVTHWSNGFDSHVMLTRTGIYTLNVTAVSLTRPATGETMWLATGSLQVNALSLSTDLLDRSLFAGADTITGSRYDNVLQGWGGNDRIDGMAGVDTVVLSGARSQYTVTRSANTVTTVGRDGTDTLVNIERIKFDDVTLALDTSGAAGQAYRLYQAAFNRTPDIAGLRYQINTLDSGHSLKAVAQNFLNSPEFSRTYGGLTDGAFVSQLYRNVLHREADSAGHAYQTAALASGTDRSQLLVNFSESPENQAALIGVIANGIAY